MLRSRQGAALHEGLAPARAFLDGYHAGLAVTIALTAAGIVVAMIALRRAGAAPTPAPETVPAPERAAADAPVELVPEQAAHVPELHAPVTSVSRQTAAQASS